MERTISTASVVAAAPGLGQRELAGETIILDPRSGTYFGLNATGTEVWRLIQEPRPVSALVEAVIARHEVGRARCEADVLRLLDDLRRHGLVTVREG